MAEPAATPTPDQPVSAPSPTAWVHFSSGSMAGQTIPLDPSGTSLGRGADNDIVLDDTTVSRRHASISFHDGNFFMEDNESASGTLVEGMQATRTMLQSGSVMRLGETEMVFMESETAPGPEATGAGAPASPGAPGETMVAQPHQEVVMAWLAVTTGPRKGQTYQLRIGDNSLGRGAENDMVIEDNVVSRSHAMVRVRDDEMVLVDLGSRGGTKVAGKTLGLVGAGNIGRKVARRLAAFEARVIYYDVVSAPEIEKDLGARRVSLEELLREADIISLHVPATPETEGIIGREALGMMKPTTVLLNTSRGPAVDEEALVEALRENRIAGAGLDVFCTEPFPADHPFVQQDNVVLSPHVAGHGYEGWFRRSRFAWENIRRVATGEPPLSLVLPE